MEVMIDHVQADEASLKIPEVWDLESFQVGDHMNVW